MCARTNAEQWHLFRRTGTVHLIAISGLHIGLIAGLIYFLVLKATAWTGILRVAPPRRRPLQPSSRGCSMPRWPVSRCPQRALIMLAMVMAGTGSAICPCIVLSCALLAILLLDPLAVLSAGFWLSFLAVSLILYAMADARLAGRLLGGGVESELGYQHWPDAGTAAVSAGFVDRAAATWWLCR